MSIGHRAALQPEPKRPSELAKIIATGDTGRLLKQLYGINVGHDVAYGGGSSVDRRTVYIDRGLAAEVRGGEVVVAGLAPRQVLAAIAAHEHAEKGIEDGDNPVDSYEPAHGFALTVERELVGSAAFARYQAALAPALRRCLRRFLAKDRKAEPPRDLWCGPYHDHADKTDDKLLMIMRARGVADAFKLSKVTVHYGFGPNRCSDCAMFAAQTSGVLRLCSLVDGLVRADRWCERWQAK